MKESLMTMSLVRPWVIVTVLVFSGLLSACGGDAPPVDDVGEAVQGARRTLAVTPEGRDAIGLAVDEVQPTALILAVTAPSKVRADQDKIALVAPTIEGRISRVFASWGDWVTAGQVLAHLESVEVGQAKASYFQARAGLSLAKSNLERKRRLFDEQIIAEKDLLEAEAEYTAVQAGADAAEKALHVIGFTEEEMAGLSESHDLTAVMPVISPIAGTIVDRKAVVGALAEPSGELFTVMDLSTVWVDAEVYEKDLAKVRPGQRVEVSLTAYPGETFLGRVKYIGDSLDEDRRTAVVRTVVENSDGRIKPGMFATSRIIVTERPEALVLPEGTVMEQGGRSVVVVEEGSGYGLREVTPGLTGDGMVEIVEGLDAGERVVIRGHYQIATQIMAGAGLE
jgi:membrane fusion protein, heavy metal efflux system